MGESLTLIEKLDAAYARLSELLDGRKPEISLILGSGLGPLADRIEDPIVVPFGDVPFMKRSTATSHVGQFVCGMLGGKYVLAMQGRLHGYEGNTAEEVAFPVWLMSRLGVKALITTNAAGAINETYRPGDFCLMRDHINFTGRNPIMGVDQDILAPRFFSMYEAYDPEFRAVALQVAREKGIALHEGVYLGLLGPSFETPAEIRAFGLWGADTVAMSVCEEVIAARHVGMRVMGISLVSNMACGVGEVPLDSPDVDGEVLDVAARAEADFSMLIIGCLERMDVS